jgi:hypothetical protein
MMGIRVPLAQLVGSVLEDRFRAELQRHGIDCAAINNELLQNGKMFCGFLLFGQALTQ